MKRYLLVSIVLALVVLGTLNPVTFAASTITPSEREITIIEKTVCFNVSISDPITNKTASKEICVAIDFHIKNAQPSNDTINVEFPVTIHVGNKTITKKVVVPLKVEGVVAKIEVKRVEGGPSETENVIIVAPTTTTPKTASPTKTTTAAKSTTTTSKSRTATTSPKPVTVTKTRTVTKTVEKKEVPMEMKDIALIIALIAVAGTLLFILLKRKPKEEKYKKKGRSCLKRKR